ncbi:TerB family tellurite resistance protein [Rubrivirga sp. S365]|uniref:TerB family tellurite resistance protein n=1 Tax=Rubrivirga litoralis TaxID=3075598 RepID=A0ABU3BPJ4_9BACT|nr:MULTISPECIES: TerB family tellurite resistance protein [unclassified Rubrivirga]MDT0631175.1 TerB family tellurite resistance protein [Rubrivirga sp. F394]MDT7856682.1 TerB family tellurite resistance protein [Rubrivirga sp. S365]
MPTPLADLAVLTLVVAHGTDADLDPRETHVLVEQLGRLSTLLDPDVHSGADLSAVVEAAVKVYGDLSVVGLDTVVARFRDAVGPPLLARAHAALVRVADADGVVHTMERTVLRHIAQAWGLEEP